MVNVKKVGNVSEADSVVGDLDKKLEKGPPERMQKQIIEEMLVPTGSTLFNLCLSDNPEGGYGLGKFVNLIGDSSAGKTVLGLTALAECANLKRFDDFELIIDDTEAALAFDMEYLFGKKAAKRIRTDLVSEKFEDWADNIERCIRSEKPFIYVLDSFDSLTSSAEVEKNSENFEAREKGNKEKGSYGSGVAKKASEFFRLKKADLKRLNSLVIVISQTRENIGFGAQFNQKVRSGGKALKFYSSHEIWLAMKKQLKPSATSEYVIGNLVEAKITKNKLTGKKRTCDFQIFYDYGLDDNQSCLDYLINKKVIVKWTKEIEQQYPHLKTAGRGAKYFFKDLEIAGTIPKIIDQIEQNNMEDSLKLIVGNTWKKIEDSLKLKRKPKYA